jgi:S-methylmethionine-dependent homocysteine/selenocysteine methylase
LGSIYKNNVDIIICETMASIYEGVVAGSVAKDFSNRVWLSWTTRGNKLNRLPSTELLADALQKGNDLDVECQLVNCIHADTASLAIDKFKDVDNFGIYANSSIYKKNKLEGFVSDADEWHYHNHQPIDHIEYKKYVQEWVDNGAFVIGGCCRTTTKHIEEIKKIVDKI